MPLAPGCHLLGGRERYGRDPWRQAMTVTGVEVNGAQWNMYPWRL